MTNRYNLLFLNVFLVFVTTGCATVPQSPESPETFLLRGKVAVAESVEHFSANLLWHQRGEGFEIDLWGPLGQGRTKIVKTDDEIEIRTDRGVVLAGEPATVMRDELGWSLPMDVLPSWVQGRPFAGVASSDLVRDEAGRLNGFKQLGWTVTLGRYQNVDDRRVLPTRVTATRAESSVRLVITEWQLAPPLESSVSL